MSATATNAISTAHNFARVEAMRLHDALRASRPGERRDRLLRVGYQGVVSGTIPADDMVAIQETVDALVFAERASMAPRKFSPRRRPRSPDRQRSIERRRMLAGSGVMPSNMRAAYTQGESAALAIILGEVKRVGVCDWPIDRIAALAGVGRSTVQSGMRTARRLGHLRITARPQRGAKSLTNIIEVGSPELRAWVERGPAALSSIGFKNTSTAHKNSGATKSVEEKERRIEVVGAMRNDRQERCGNEQRQRTIEMKRRNIATARRPEFWIAHGSPEYEAWQAKARADGRTIAEYVSAVHKTSGFYRRTPYPPDMPRSSSAMRSAPPPRRSP